MEERELMEPSWALPVTVAGDLVLVRRPGVLASIGALCAHPTGFLFYLVIGMDRDRVAERMVTFRDYGKERALASRVRVVFADGRAADSQATFTGQMGAGEPVLRFRGGHSEVRDYSLVPRSESRWWVSPLPPPGPVEFILFLQGEAEPSGSAVVDAAVITEAAGRSQALWPGRGIDQW